MGNEDIKLIKELREKTGCGVMECKTAIREAAGDVSKAELILREKGLAGVQKKASRVTGEGVIHSYIHSNKKVGVLIEVNCETDFVARSDVFSEMVHDLAMQIAALSPLYISEEDVPGEDTERERELYRNMALKEGKPENVVDKIVDGKLKKYYEQFCLLHQPFVKDQDKKIIDLINGVIQKTGENISVKRFTRFQVGE